MDDLTIGERESVVARDVDTVHEKGEEIGLRLNNKKCEFVSTTAQSSDPVFNDFIRLSVHNVDSWPH